MEISLHDLAQLSQALLASLAVAVPLLLSFVRTQNKVYRAKQLVQLLNARKSLQRRIDDFGRVSSDSDTALSKVRAVLNDLEQEIAEVRRPGSGRQYLLLAAGLEVFVLALIVFNFPLQERLAFFEGSFQYAELQFVLVLIIVALSVVVALSEKAKALVPKSLAKHSGFILFIIFNATFFVLFAFTSVLLMVIDPHTKAF